MVIRALEMVGFEMSDDAENITGLYDRGEKVAIVAIEGTVGQIDVDKYRGLLKQVQDELERSGQLSKGILIGNGFRLELPSNRGNQFTESCRRGTWSQGFALTSADELFDAVHAILSDPSEDLKTQIKRRILNTSGDIVLVGLHTRRPILSHPHELLNPLISRVHSVDVPSRVGAYLVGIFESAPPC